MYHLSLAIYKTEEYTIHADNYQHDVLVDALKGTLGLEFALQAS